MFLCCLLFIFFWMYVLFAFDYTFLGQQHTSFVDFHYTCWFCFSNMYRNISHLTPHSTLIIILVDRGPICSAPYSDYLRLSDLRLVLSHFYSLCFSVLCFMTSILSAIFFLLVLWRTITYLFLTQSSSFVQLFSLTRVWSILFIFCFYFGVLTHALFMHLGF